MAPPWWDGGISARHVWMWVVAGVATLTPGACVFIWTLLLSTQLMHVGTYTGILPFFRSALALCLDYRNHAAPPASVCNSRVPGNVNWCSPASECPSSVQGECTQWCSLITLAPEGVLAVSLLFGGCFSSEGQCPSIRAVICFDPPDWQLSFCAQGGSVGVQITP